MLCIDKWGGESMQVLSEEPNSSIGKVVWKHLLLEICT